MQICRIFRKKVTYTFSFYFYTKLMYMHVVYLYRHRLQGYLIIFVLVMNFCNLFRPGIEIKGKICLFTGRNSVRMLWTGSGYLCLYEMLGHGKIWKNMQTRVKLCRNAGKYIEIRSYVKVCKIPCIFSMLLNTKFTNFSYIVTRYICDLKVWSIIISFFIGRIVN